MASQRCEAFLSGEARWPFLLCGRISKLWRMLELLTPTEMAEADRRAIAVGPFDGLALMRRAGAAVAAEVLRRYPAAETIHVLCGPGNNGGDGYVIARLLHEAGASVQVRAEGVPRAGSEAAIVAAGCPVEMAPLDGFDPKPGSVVIDALYGAGLSKPLGGAALAAIARTRDAGTGVVAVDLPSGVSGETGQVLGGAFRAALTVTFARKKPGHVLEPGRRLCGEIVVADIGIPDAVISSLGVRCFENLPALWLGDFPWPADDTHKYRRGHVAVFSGSVASTGAARLSALAAARAGAGAVTMLSPAAALTTHAAHLTSIILRKADGLADLEAFLAERKPQAFVLGPGFGVKPHLGDYLFPLLGQASPLVLDADALTMASQQADSFLAAARREGAPPMVLTPHEGEFARLFPCIAGDAGSSKLDKARQAAALANATIIHKGPDTVIASPDGRAAINSNGTPLLASAGSGDVLAGIVAGLLAQGMPTFEAACAAVWMHAEAARAFGPGLIAEDLPGRIPGVLRALEGMR